MSGLVQHIAPSTGPLTIAEVRRHLHLDLTDGEPAPGAPSVAMASPAVPGNVNNGHHHYLVTFVTSDGETQSGTPSISIDVTDNTVNGKVALSNIPLGSGAVLARNVYRTEAEGSIYYLQSTIADNTTTGIVDNIADGSLGVSAPNANTTDDPSLTLLIASACRAAEAATNRALVTQTWDLYLDEFPAWEIEIPKPPLQSIEFITYLDNDGVEQTLPTTEYLVNAVGEPASITPAFGKVWPVTRAQFNAVKIRFVCGYGTASMVEPEIKRWMLLYIGTLDQNRESVVSEPHVIPAELPGEFVNQLVRAYRVHTFY